MQVDEALRGYLTKYDCMLDRSSSESSTNQFAGSSADINPIGGKECYATWIASNTDPIKVSQKPT